MGPVKSAKGAYIKKPIVNKRGMSIKAVSAILRGIMIEVL
jgi:hypothetical protein